MKEYYFDLQNERADEWIRERLEDENAEEGSEEWQELANEYGNFQEHLMEEAQFKAELEWLRNNGSSVIHQGFIQELDTLKKIVDKNLKGSNFLEVILNDGLIVKMTYSYAVTLLEAFLSDTLKSLISENPEYLKNAIVNVDELKKVKYSLLELSSENIDVSSLALRKISELLFHNIEKIKIIYGQVLGKKLNIDISEIVKVRDIRHHIVHRNGKKINGEYIKVTIEDLDEAIIHIKNFAKKLQLEINSKFTV